jgi:hypothetical protein
VLRQRDSAQILDPRFRRIALPAADLQSARAQGKLIL